MKYFSLKIFFCCLFFFSYLEESVLAAPNLGLTTKQLFFIGDSLHQCNQYEQASEYFEVLIGLNPENQSMEDYMNYIIACRRLAQYNYALGSYHKTYEYALKGISCCEQIHSTEYISSLYNYCGNVLSIYKDYERATEYYSKALAVAKETQDVLAQIKVLNNLIGVSCYLKDVSKAIKYRSEQKCLPLDDKELIYYAITNDALILETDEQYFEALLLYHYSLAKAESYGDRLLVWNALLSIADLQESMGRLDSALYYQLKVEAMSLSLQSDLTLNHLQSMARLYEQLGNRSQAILYKERYLNLSDSLMNLNELSRIKNTQLAYEMNKSSYQINQLHQETIEKEHKIDIQRRISMVILLILLIVVLFSFLIYREKRKLQHSYDKLFEQSKRLLHIEEENKLLKQQLNERLLHSPSINGDAEEQKLKSKMSEEQQQTLWMRIIETLERPEVFTDPDLTREKLAAMVDSNSKYVSLVVNETYKNNFRNLINEYRVKEAQRRMLNTDEYGLLTISAISEGVGYKSYTSFASAFKDFTGLSPSVYYRMIQEESKNNGNL